MASALEVRPVDPAQHLAFVESRSGSFLQTPAWGRLKTDWRAESLGWFGGEEMVVLVTDSSVDMGKFAEKVRARIESEAGVARPNLD